MKIRRVPLPRTPNLLLPLHQKALSSTSSPSQSLPRPQKELDAEEITVTEEPGDCKGYLVSRVSPVGWVNSVTIAQHIHRNVVRSCLGSLSPSVGGECELRRGRLFSSIPKLFRVYLRSFDGLIRVDKRIAGVIAGTPSPEVQHLREASGASQDTLRRLQNRSCKQKFKEHGRMVSQVQSMWRSPFRCFTPVQLLSESYRWLEVGWCTLRCSDAPFYVV